MSTINVKDFTKSEVKVNLNGVIFTAKEYEIEQQDGSVTTATRRNAILRKAGYNVVNGVAFDGGDVVISKSDFDAALIAAAPMQLLEKARIKKSLVDELGAEFVTDEIVDEMFYNNFVAVIEFEPMLAGKFTGYDGSEKTREHDYIKTTLVRIERKTKQTCEVLFALISLSASGSIFLFLTSDNYEFNFDLSGHSFELARSVIVCNRTINASCQSYIYLISVAIDADITVTSNPIVTLSEQIGSNEI